MKYHYVFLSFALLLSSFAFAGRGDGQGGNGGSALNSKKQSAASGHGSGGFLDQVLHGADGNFKLSTMGGATGTAFSGMDYNCAGAGGN